MVTKKPTTRFSIDNWLTQLRKGMLELCIVNLLAENEVYGYDLVKQLTELNGLSVSVGTVYPLLSRMRRAGLLSARLVESDSGPARKYYALTDEGRRYRRLMAAHWRELTKSLEELNER